MIRPWSGGEGACIRDRGRHSPLFFGEAVAFDNKAFDIEAHRGGRALFPENTLQSFANALTMGVDTLELDIGVTLDGAIKAGVA